MPRKLQKAKDRAQLKSPKNHILENRKVEFTRQLLGWSHRNTAPESHHISTRLARRGGVAQSVFCEGFGLHQGVSTRFCLTTRNRRNSLKTNHRPISTRF